MAGAIDIGLIYTPRRSTRLPYDVRPLLAQNQTVYFQLLSAGTQVGSYKTSIPQFNELFEVNNMMDKRPVPIAIPLEKFIPFNPRIL